MAEDALDVKPRGARRPGNLDRGPRPGHPSPTLPRIDLDADAQRAPRAAPDRRREPLRPGGGVDADPELGQRLVQRSQPRRLRALGRPDRVGDEQVPDPRRREDLGLADRPDGQPGRAGVDLEPGDPDALVGLRVWPEGDPPPVELGLEAGDVRPDAVEVDDELRRVDAGGQVAEGQGAGRRRCPRRHQVGRATTGDRSVPSRSIASPTSSPGSRKRPSVSSLDSSRLPPPTVPDPRISPGSEVDVGGGSRQHLAE